MSTAPFVPGSSTSQAAAQSLTSATLAHLERVVFEEIEKAGPLGCTDKELEDRCQLSHESTSARRRKLVEKGLVKDSGSKRKSPAGREVSIWVLGKENFVRPGPDQPMRHAKPSKKELETALAELRQLMRAMQATGSYVPSPAFVKFGKWVVDLAGDP